MDFNSSVGRMRCRESPGQYRPLALPAARRCGSLVLPDGAATPPQGGAARVLDGQPSRPTYGPTVVVTTLLVPLVGPAVTNTGLKSGPTTVSAS